MSTFSEVAAPLSTEQAIFVSQQGVIAAGFKNKDWFGGRVRATFEEGSREWLVFFDSKRTNGRFTAGDHIGVRLSEDGNIIRFIGGR